MGKRLETFLQVLAGARARRGAAVMGICNVTPDSFSDGGRYHSSGDGRRRVDEILAEGADLVDVGGESTRPGSAPVSPALQLERVLPVVRHAVSRGAAVTIDTHAPEVAAACLEAGAVAVNDVSCLRDERLADVVASAGAGLVLMHARAPMAEMQGFGVYPDAAYVDVVRDVVREWEAAAARAQGRGVARAALVMDPGLGFSKNARQSTRLLVELRAITGSLDVPVLVGASRKSFLASVDPSASPELRIGASLAAAIHAVRAGAAAVRVHDVRATVQAIDWSRKLDRVGEG